MRIRGTKGEIFTFFGTVKHCSLLGKMLSSPSHYIGSGNSFYLCFRFKAESEGSNFFFVSFLFSSPNVQALTEPGYGSDASSVATTATKVGHST